MPAVRGVGVEPLIDLGHVPLSAHVGDSVDDADPVRCGTTMPGTDVPVISPDQASAQRPDLVLALDDLPESPEAWESAPVYAVSDLIDVLHRLTGAMAPPRPDGVDVSRGQARPELAR